MRNSLNYGLLPDVQLNIVAPVVYLKTREKKLMKIKPNQSDVLFESKIALFMFYQEEVINMT